PHGSKIYRRKPKSTTTPTKVLVFEEPAEKPVNTASTAVNTGSTPSAQVNTGSTPLAQVNTAEVNTAELNTGETERVQRREGKAPMTEEDLQAEVQASNKARASRASREVLSQLLDLKLETEEESTMALELIAIVSTDS
ncbi:hypothetical protein Tco_0263897, partial [Tanacetum coccineum]